MKNNLKRIFMIILAQMQVVALFGQAQVAGLKTKNVRVSEKVEMVSNRNVIDIIRLAFPIFYSHIKRAGFASSIQGATAMTIFAPTDKAFQDLIKFIGEDAYNEIFNITNSDEGLQKLRKILKLHILPDKTLSSDLVQMKSIQPYGERKLNFSTKDGIITINDTSAVVEADIVGTNGVVHAIDAVILP